MNANQRGFLLAVAFAGCGLAQPLEYTVVKEDILLDRLKLAHTDPAERYNRLKGLFEFSGCRGDSYREQIVKRTKEPNVICTVAGSGNATRKIIVGAHFDAKGSLGVIDNWAGAVLLPGLFAMLTEKPPRHTFEFVGFTAEEKGLLGSRAFVKAISKEDRKQIAAMINVDSIGLTFTKCWTSGSTKELVLAAASVAQALKLEFQGMNMDLVGTTDSASFKQARIPVLSLHSITTDTLPVLHNSKDTWGAVSWKDYYDTYRLISLLLVYLDRTLP